MKSRREWWVNSRSCHARKDGPFARAVQAARRAEKLVPEDGYHRVWITSKALPPPVRSARLAKTPGGLETLERLQRWPGLVNSIKLPCYIYSRRRNCFLHEDGKGWVRGIPRQEFPQFPGVPKTAGDWEPEVALKMARKLDPMDEIELHELF